MHNVPNYFTLLLLRVINAQRLARERVYPVSSARDLLLRDYESPRNLPTSFSFSISLLDGRFSAPFLLLSVISYISSTRGAQPRASFLPFSFPSTVFFFLATLSENAGPEINPRLIVTHHALRITTPHGFTLYLYCATLLHYVEIYLYPSRYTVTSLFSLFYFCYFHFFIFNVFFK